MTRSVFASLNPQVQASVKLTWDMLSPAQQTESFRDIVVQVLQEEGYTIPDDMRELIRYTGTIDIQEFDKLRAILDDKTGLTAAMYGINLEDE